MSNFRPGPGLGLYDIWEYPQALTIEDYSRVDARIALQLRSNDHSRESVEETFRSCAPTIREKQAGRNWQRYAKERRIMLSTRQGTETWSEMSGIVNCGGRVKELMGKKV